MFENASRIDMHQVVTISKSRIPVPQLWFSDIFVHATACGTASHSGTCESWDNLPKRDSFGRQLTVSDRMRFFYLLFVVCF